MAQLNVDAVELLEEHIQPRQATLRGNLTNMGDADEVICYFEYTSNPGFANNPGSVPEEDIITTEHLSPLTEIGVFTQQITDLDPETTYYFRAIGEGQ